MATNHGSPRGAIRAVASVSAAHHCIEHRTDSQKWRVDHLPREQGT